MSNALENIGNRADQMEESISEFKDRNLEMTKEEEKELSLKNMKELYRTDYTGKSRIRIMDNPEVQREKKNREPIQRNNFENFPNLGQGLDIRV